MHDADQQRYHLTVTIDGRPVVHGWWSDRTTADRKYRGWIGDYGSRSGARITLTDTATGEQLAAWP